MKILGVDPGLTKPGFYSDLGAWSLNLSGMSEWDAYAELAEAYTALLGTLANGEDEGLLVVCENPTMPRFGSGVKTLLAQGCIRCVTKQMSLTKIFVPVWWVDMPPKSLKKFATGDGNASKRDVLFAARDAGVLVHTEDEADAYWLWRIGKLYEELDGCWGGAGQVTVKAPTWTTVMPERVAV